LSDHSFQSYAAALAYLKGPRLAADTDLFWNQGFFDAQFEYALTSQESHLWIHANVAPELAQRVKLQLEVLSVGSPPRSCEIPGGSGWIPLDPRWYEAAWLFGQAGFVDAFAIDRLVFLLCLVAPFRRVASLLAVLMVLIAMQALTLTAAGVEAIREIHWLPAVFDVGLAAAVVLLAIGNLGAPRLRRRWIVAAVIGALGGFAVGHLLFHLRQFGGDHSVVSVVSFNLGVAVGEIVGLALALLLRWPFTRVLGPSLGLVVLSAIVGHAGWHWMMDGGHELGHAVAGLSFASIGAVLLWLLPACLLGGIAFFLPSRLDGLPFPSLLSALLDRGSEATAMPTDRL